ncbi:Frag1/DRAM/Sfk1 family protein [Acanthocheilonema viteae]
MFARFILIFRQHHCRKMTKNIGVSSMKLLLINRTLLAIIGALLPGVGCCMCIVYIYTFEFHRVEKSIVPVCPNTHNVFPPVSYIIGIWEPTRTVWFCVMFINFPARILYPFFYNYLYKRSNTSYANLWWYKILNQSLMISLFLEPLSIVVITIFDVVSSFYIHATAFGVWLITLCFNMFASILLYYFSGESKNSKDPSWLFHLKLVLCAIAIMLSLSMPCTYLYAVAKCHQFTYALFSITEYILVPINSLFHFFIYWDCSNVSVKLTVSNRRCLSNGNVKLKNLLLAYFHIALIFIKICKIWILYYNPIK